MSRQKRRYKTGVVAFSERLGHVMNGSGKEKYIFLAEADQRGEKGALIITQERGEVTR